MRTFLRTLTNTIVTLAATCLLASCDVFDSDDSKPNYDWAPKYYFTITPPVLCPAVLTKPSSNYLWLSVTTSVRFAVRQPPALTCSLQVDGSSINIGVDKAVNPGDWTMPYSNSPQWYPTANRFFTLDIDGGDYDLTFTEGDRVSVYSLHVEYDSLNIKPVKIASDFVEGSAVIAKCFGPDPLGDPPDDFVFIIYPSTDSGGGDIVYHLGLAGPETYYPGYDIIAETIVDDTRIEITVTDFAELTDIFMPTRGKTSVLPWPPGYQATYLSPGLHLSEGEYDVVVRYADQVASCPVTIGLDAILFAEPRPAVAPLARPVTPRLVFQPVALPTESVSKTVTQ
jgi:hypothetical protein